MLLPSLGSCFLCLFLLWFLFNSLSSFHSFLHHRFHFLPSCLSPLIPLFLPFFLPKCFLDDSFLSSPSLFPLLLNPDYVQFSWARFVDDFHRFCFWQINSWFRLETDQHHWINKVKTLRGFVLHARPPRQLLHSQFPLRFSEDSIKLTQLENQQLNHPETEQKPKKYSELLHTYVTSTRQNHPLLMFWSSVCVRRKENPKRGKERREEVS